MMNADDPSNTGSPPPAKAPVARRGRWARWRRRAIRGIVFAYLLAALVVFLIQNWLIFPGAYVHNRQASRVEAEPGRELVTLATANGQQIAAVFGHALNADGSPADHPESRPTLLFFYGNGDCLRTSMGTFADLRRLGVNVLIPEYVGYPMSTGSPGEAGLYDTANSAYAYLRSRPDVAPGLIIVVGRSIGGGPAIDLAAREPVAGLATFSAFTSMDRMARKVLPIFPTGLFLRTHLNNEEKIARVKCPIFLAHGVNDTFVPFSMMGQLAQRAGAPVTVVPVERADHNTIFSAGGVPLRLRFGQFIKAIAPASGS